MRLVTPHQELDALKPNQIDDTRTIRKMSHQPTLPSLANGFKTENLPFQLDIGHIAVYFMDVIQTASIYIFIGKIMQQIM